MSKRRKRTDDPNQLTIFDLIKSLREEPEPVNQGCLNTQVQLQGILSDCIKQCPLSRWEIAGKMSMLLGSEITKYMLDTWTAESKEYHRFPAEYLPAFCHAVESHRALEFLAKQAGVFVLPGPEALRSEIQKIEEDIKGLQERRRKRLIMLGEINDE